MGYEFQNCDSYGFGAMYGTTYWEWRARYDHHTLVEKQSNVALEMN